MMCWLTRGASVRFEPQSISEDGRYTVFIYDTLNETTVQPASPGLSLTTPQILHISKFSPSS